VTTDDRTFPAALAALAEVPYPFGDDDGEYIEYERYEQFTSAEETTQWLRGWTGNSDLDGDSFRLFAQDGSGGVVASWLVRSGRPLTEQPVVFFGSEGEVGAVATSLGEFLWLLAAGVGPMEAVQYGAEAGLARADLRTVAEMHSGISPRTPADVLGAARAEFPDFAVTVDTWCR
jgi:hypothetical protein